MKFTSADKEILRAVLAAEKVDVYQLHEKYLLSPGQIADSVMRLSQVGVIVFKNGLLEATPDTRDWVLHHRYEVFRTRFLAWRSRPRDKIGNATLRPMKRRVMRLLDKREFRSS